MAEPKPTPNEAKNDLIKLLKTMPDDLPQMLFQLRIKYNVPIVRVSAKTPPQPKKLTNKNK